MERRTELPPDGRTISAPRGGGKYDWPAIVEEMKAHEGEWVLVDPAASRGITSAVRNRRMVALRETGWVFEHSTRDNDVENKTCALWMRATKGEEK